MKARKYVIKVLGVLVVSGCATHWQHSSITDVEQANRQFKLDDGYCLRVAYGAVPMPPISVQPTGTMNNVSGQMRVYDASTGTASFGAYSGAIVSSPASSFASGFANGVAIGAAIQAQRIQDKVHEECMIRKGWKEASLGESRAAPMLGQQNVSVATDPSRTSKASSEAIYEDDRSAWLADVDEFVMIYPEYRESRHLWDRLDAAVKKMAGERSLATTQKILLAAHDHLNLKKEGAPEPARGDQRWIIVDMYRQAVAANSVVDQNALGVAFESGMAPLRQDYRRALYWFRKSALAGDSFGRISYGTLVFEGKGQIPDRSRGYGWVQKAAAAGDKDAQDMLPAMKARMSDSELQAARAFR